MTIKTSGSQKEQQVVELNRKQPVLLHYDVDYDSMKPEDTIRTFVGDIRDMLGRFESNKARIFEIEAELNDLEHYMEIGNFKNVPEGYKLYRRLAELRRERRASKNENDLLAPIWEYFHATEVLNRLTKVQGDCAKLQETIDSRTYAVRTDILDEWLNPKPTTESTKERDISLTNDMPEEFVGVDLLHYDYDPQPGDGDLLFQLPEESEEFKGMKNEKAKYVLKWKEAMKA